MTDSQARHPKHPQVPKILQKFASQRTDPYFWMRERDSSEVMAALDQEQQYFQSYYRQYEPIVEDLFAQMKSRVAEEDVGAPVEYQKNYYFEKHLPGTQYPQLYLRTREGKEDLLLDFEEMAANQSYFDVGSWKLSDDETILAYSLDTVGRRIFTVFFFDLATRSLLPNRLENVTSTFVFGQSAFDIYHTKQHATTLRAHEAYHFDLRTGQSALLFQEPDEKFYVSLSRGTSPSCIFISADSTTTSEVQFVEFSNPQKVQPTAGRRSGHEYSVTDGGDAFYFISNFRAKNFSIFRAPKAANLEPENWHEIISGSSEVLIEGLTVYAEHLVVEQRSQGLERIVVYDRQTLTPRQLPTQDPAYSLGVQGPRAYHSAHFTYAYQSMNRPLSLLKSEFKTLNSEVLWQKQVPGFDADKYESRRIWIAARDGTQIPVTLLMQKGFQQIGQAPLLLYGYGSYGLSLNPGFSISKLSLIDRGWVFAMAHVRGGSEMGRHWYEDGRQLKKINTFTDYIDAAKSLAAQKYCDSKKLFAMGGSAGGLLMGVVMNMEPQLFRAVVAAVPFVDIVSTMLDETIPLTTGEYEEWGDPNQEEFFKYILSYSPYDNLKSQAYPFLLITSGYHDSQVQYWEPLKWAAKLRDHSTSGQPVLLDMNREAGHAGATGRYSYLKEIAKEYGFLVWREQQ